MEHMKYDVDDEVYWNDPDEGFASGYYTITEIVNDEIVVLDHNTEVIIWEMS